MTKEPIFNDAYPFVLPEGNSSMIKLEDVIIPPKNIIARLNDQWVKEIGLDMKKFGYGYSLKDLLNKKIGEKVNKNNLLEKIRILQTIGNIFTKLEESAKKQVIEFIEQEPILYPNFRGSRDQTFFHHRKQLTVVLLEILPYAENEIIKKSILDIIFDILEDNFLVVKRKTYFDEYNSYTYSEEQRNIAKTIVTGIEKKLLSYINIFSKDEQIRILRKLWIFPMLQNNFDLKKKIIKEIYVSNHKNAFNEIQKVIEDLEKTFAPELDVLKEVAMEESLESQDVNAEQVIKFYHGNIKDDEMSAANLITEKLEQLFNNTNDKTEKDKIIKLLISPQNDDDSIDIINDKYYKNNTYLPLINIFISNEEASKMIFSELLSQDYNCTIFKDIKYQINEKYDLLTQFRKKMSSLLMNIFDKDKIDDDIDKDLLINNIVEIIRNDLMDEETGKNFINILLEKKDIDNTCDTILQKIFQKGHESDLGRYLQYILLTRK